MYGISISLVSLVLVTIALSVGILGDAGVFPVFSNGYTFANILVVAFLFLLFVESSFLSRKNSNSIKQTSSIGLKHRLRVLLVNVAESLYLIILLLPFIAACRIFLAIEIDKIIQPLLVFAFFIVIFRLIICCLSSTNTGFERFMRIFILLTFLLPILGFCVWEFVGTSAGFFAYLSPVWFLVEALRSRFLVVLPFFIIWLVPTILFISLYLIRANKPEAAEGSVQN